MDSELKAALWELKRTVVRRVYEKRGVELSVVQRNSIELDSSLEDFSPPTPMRSGIPRTEPPDGVGTPRRSRLARPNLIRTDATLKFLKGFGIALLWVPSLLFGFYFSPFAGPTATGQASDVGWLILCALVIAPFFVLAGRAGSGGR